jgi:hypothetical protein
MKKTVLTLLAAMAASVAMGQGTVLFSNRVLPQIDAPVTFGGDLRPGAPAGPAGPAAGPALVGQLLAGPVGGQLAPVGVPVAFRAAGAGAGYVPGSTVIVPTVPKSSPAQIVFVAWVADLGATYAEALAAGIGGTGQSAPITVSLGGEEITPANMTGLAGFSVAPVIPEPSVLALGALGAGWLMLRRKKS